MKIFCIAPAVNKAAALFKGKGLAGAFISVDWGQIAPARGKYDWSAADALVAALPAGMPYKFAITPGLASPSWLLDENPGVLLSLASRVKGPPEQVKMAPPWLENVLEDFTDAHTAYAKHVGDLSRIYAIDPIIYSGLGDEITVPWCVDNVANPGNAAAWAAAGFRPTGASVAWQDCLDSLSEIYPDAKLMLTPHMPHLAFPPIDDDGVVHAVLDTTELMSELLGYAGNEYGTRAVAIYDAYSNQGGMPAFYQQAVEAGCAAGGQCNAWDKGGLVAGGTHEAPVASSADVMRSTLQMVQSTGIEYFEVHPADAEAYGDVLAAFAD